MKSPKYLAIVFVLLFTFTVKAETPFVIESVWTVGNNEWLTNANVNLTGNPAGTDLKFPNEIPADVAWSGATVIDGNIIGTIIALPAPRANVISGFQESMFRLNLRSNAIIAAAFPNGFQMFRQLSDLYLVSPELTRADIDALNLEDHWWNLQRQTHFGVIQYYPERTLLPTLPPEQEDESDFIKKVRGRSANNYKDGQFTGTVDSFLMGFRNMENNEFRIVWEQRYVEGMEPLNDVASSPFPFGGFIDPDASFSAAFRVPFGKESFKDWLSMPFGGRVGMGVTPPDERKNDHKYYLDFRARAFVGYSEGEDYHLIRDGNVHVVYPKQPEDRPAEEGVLGNEELDKMNEEMAHSALAFLIGARDSLLSMDWSQPLDFAVSSKDNIGYLALAYPPAETPIDWSLAILLAHTIFDGMRQTLPPDDPKYVEFDEALQVETQEIPGTIAGLACYRVKFSFGDKLAIVYAYEPGIIYAAVLPLKGDADEVAEEQYAAMQHRLEEKIEASRRGIAEKMSPPRTVLRSNHEGTRLRADYETTARGFRITVHVAQDSFGNVLALGQQFGMNPLQMLPFLKQ